MNKGKIIVLGVFAFVALVILLGVFNILPVFKQNNGGDPNYPTSKITLTMWGVGDSQSDFMDAFKSYSGLHDNIKLTYESFDSWNDYETKLIKALAQGAGPDIFMVDSSWAYSHSGIMLPAYTQIITANNVASIYPDVISGDFVKNGKVLALPLYMDALVMAYNKNMFNSSAISFPPTTWDDFVSDVVKLRSVDNSGNIIQSGTAMGTADNIYNSADILSTIMIQLGSKINTENSEQAETAVDLRDPALNAFKFYTQFANPISPYYTWNNSQKSSEDAFSDGNVGMIIDYRSGINNIENKNPFLKIGIAPIPQANQYRAKSFASYSGLSVSKQISFSRAYVAWDFIKMMSTNPSVNKTYLDKVDRLSALKSEIQKMIGGDNDVYARAFLYATSWKRINWNKIKEIFANSINDVLSRKISNDQAVRGIEADINAIQ